MAAIINTVRLLLISIGISDVRIFNGQSDAERLSSDMFDDDFRSCIDLAADFNDQLGDAK